MATRRSDAPELLAIHLAELGLEFVREYRFHEDRKWRADFFIAEYSILIEIEGSVWVQGRHTRGAGFLADMEKYNTATMQGYRVLRFSTQQVLDGSAKRFLKSWLTRSAQ